MGNLLVIGRHDRLTDTRAQLPFFLPFGFNGGVNPPPYAHRAPQGALFYVRSSRKRDERCPARDPFYVRSSARKLQCHAREGGHPALSEEPVPACAGTTNDYFLQPGSNVLVLGRQLHP